jgi:hypothetical protein
MSVAIAILVATAAGSVCAAWLKRASDRRLRESLLAELRPATLANCTLERFGGPNDGGYVMCGNLLQEAQVAYSYGIGGEDSWGCQMAREHRLRVHQYDCFDLRRPRCKGAATIFHEQCVGGHAMTVKSRVFDTVSRQISRNGDGGKRLVVKMDVEGAEWESLMATPDDVLGRIDQLALEFHGTTSPRFLPVVQKLKRTFHVVHLHFNNNACSEPDRPFPASAYQVLFVNKRIGVVHPSGTPGPLPPGLDAPDDPTAPDCQLPAIGDPRGP